MSNLQEYQEEFVEQTRKELRELHIEKKNLSNTNITLYDYAHNYRIIDFIFGTMIGFSITYIIKDISVDIVSPILKYLIFKDIETITVGGVVFNLERIVANIIFAAIVILILLIFARLINSATSNFHISLKIKLWKLVINKNNYWIHYTKTIISKY